jgi:hypothetical protein
METTEDIVLERETPAVELRQESTGDSSAALDGHRAFLDALNVEEPDEPNVVRGYD